MTHITENLIRFIACAQLDAPKREEKLDQQIFKTDI